MNNLYQVVSNLSHQAGAHAFRVIAYRRSLRGAYTFSSVANLLVGVYNNPGVT
jgi:hypothetical protein